MGKKRAQRTDGTAIAYCRVSTLDQAEEGVSLEAQRAQIKEWANRKGFKLLRVYEDAGLSGGRADNRPALQDALRHVRRCRAALVTHSLSRLARNVKDAMSISEGLEKAGADLVSLTEEINTTTATGRLFFGFLALLGAFERDLTRERTVAAMDVMRRRGARISRIPPLGYRFRGDSVIPNRAEQKTIAYIHELRAQGLTLRAITERLNDEDVPARGTRWHLKTIHRVIESEAA